MVCGFGLHAAAAGRGGWPHPRPARLRQGRSDRAEHQRRRHPQPHAHNDWIQFSSRFGGISHEISIPVDRVMAIFARENGQGLHFEPIDTPEPPDQAPPTPPGEAPAPPKGKPSLKVVK